MKRNGRAPSGAQRWRCRSCGASATHSNDVAARELAAFVGWLLSRGTQADMPGRGRTFRRRAALFWPIWPMPEVVDEVFRVVYVDGIWIARDCVVPIACSGDEHVLFVAPRARRDDRRVALAALAHRPARHGGHRRRQRLRPRRSRPNGRGRGSRDACSTRSARSRGVRRRGPSCRRASKLYALARELLHVETLQQADWWVERFMQWCEFWSDFLEQKSLVEGRMAYTHRRLREARSGLVRLVNAGTLFTYLDPALCAEGPMPATNNRIEGGVNSQPREVLRSHRGLAESSSASRPCSGGATCMSNARRRWRTRCARCPPTPTSTC